MSYINILHVNKAYYPHIGGVEKVVQDISENLDNTKFKTHVLVCNMPNGPRIQDFVSGIKIIRCKTFCPLFIHCTRHF